MDSEYIPSGWRLEQFHLVLSLLHLTSSSILAILLVTVGASSWPVFETIASRDGTTTHHHPSIQAGWLLVVAGFMSATHHGFVRLYKLSDRSARVLRWIDYACSSGLMLVVISVLSGVGNPWLLFDIVVVQAMLMLASGVGEMIIEHQTKADRVYGYLFVFVATLIHVFGCWGATFSALYYQNVPAFVHVIVVTLFLFFMSFGVVYLYVIYRPESIQKADWFYALLSLSVKLDLQWSLYGGTARNTDQTLVVSILTSFIVIGSMIAAVFIHKHLSTRQS